MPVVTSIPSRITFLLLKADIKLFINRKNILLYKIKTKNADLSHPFAALSRATEHTEKEFFYVLKTSVVCLSRHSLVRRRTPLCDKSSLGKREKKYIHINYQSL
jgi:hypothetical protein